MPYTALGLLFCVSSFICFCYLKKQKIDNFHPIMFCVYSMFTMGLGLSVSPFIVELGLGLSILLCLVSVAVLPTKDLLDKTSEYSKTLNKQEKPAALYQLVFGTKKDRT
ncbi:MULTISPECIES: hypothetical protein [Vibrio]|uniref:hypothetical protein n=1 Tax=Vibrio TaxID=662 RepID=UPI000D733130|nr:MULTISPECIES: hypothetical protein [Vibrio]EHU9451463.1 hypothetical protein [Vibrio vulnificus]ELV8623277.1 hypothetical protein [Vibrio vulnificus]ELV8738149.1 hypothetical protein [Vibrio vulnificus]MCU8300071.1 hypothetical protein [Vibrio vulnificus]PXA66146.1 hypothetical protein DMC15_16500 [Vibrio sp. 11986-1-5]